MSASDQPPVFFPENNADVSRWIYKITAFSQRSDRRIRYLFIYLWKFFPESGFHFLHIFFHFFSHRKTKQYLKVTHIGKCQCILYIFQIRLWTGDLSFLYGQSFRLSKMRFFIILNTNITQYHSIKK